MENSNNFSNSNHGRINSNLYSRAKVNRDTERPNISNHRIIKSFKNPIKEEKECDKVCNDTLNSDNEKIFLPNINQSNINYGKIR